MSTQIGATNVLTGKLALGCVTFGRESAQRNRTAAWITPSNMHRLDRHRERTANPKCLASFFECRRHLAAGIVEKPIGFVAKFWEEATQAGTSRLSLNLVTQRVRTARR